MVLSPWGLRRPFDQRWISFLAAVFQPATDHPGCSGEPAAQQEQAGRPRNFTLKAANAPLIDLGESCVAQGLNGHAVYHRAFSRLNAEEVLTIGIDREYLVEDLTAGQCVVDCELHLCRRSEAVGNVDVENQLL